MKLSIITINRNNGVGLLKTIQSVVSQKLIDIEYIVIDGASTDDSVNIIKEYSSQISYWISEPDSGIYNAMNKGILKARGEYLLFLNSGDWLVDNIFERFDLKNYVEDIIYGNIIVDYKDGLKSVSKGCGKENLTFFDFYNDTIRHQAAFIKRDLLLQNGLYNENYKIVSDWLFFINVIIWGNAKTRYIDENISHFDAYGLGGSLEAKIETRLALESILPKKILEDYDKMKKQAMLIEDISIQLNRYINRFHYIDSFVSKLKKFINNFVS